MKQALGGKKYAHKKAEVNPNWQQKENGVFPNVYVAEKFKELQCFRKEQHVCVTVNTPFYTKYNGRHIQSSLRCLESCTKQCMFFFFKCYFSKQLLNVLKGVNMPVIQLSSGFGARKE